MEKGTYPRWLGLVALVDLMSVACGDGEPSLFATRREAAGELVKIAGGETTVGFSHGKLRKVEEVKGFSVMKHPVTVKQYKSCEHAGACKPPKLEDCSNPELAKQAMEGDGDNVALCVGYENAVRFCKWVDGRLPTLPEWLKAARGAEVQEHPWGKKPATCQQHPRSVLARDPWGTDDSRKGCAVSQSEALLTKTHSAGASPWGVEDVLLASGELVKGSDGTLFTSCDMEKSCLVYGLNPGSIDAIREVRAQERGVSADQQGEPERRTAPIHAFRCALDNGQSAKGRTR